jgi:hypothetical protein
MKHDGGTALLYHVLADVYWVQEAKKFRLSTTGLYKYCAGKIYSANRENWNALIAKIADGFSSDVYLQQEYRDLATTLKMCVCLSMYKSGSDRRSLDSLLTNSSVFVSSELELSHILYKTKDIGLLQGAASGPAAEGIASAVQSFLAASLLERWAELVRQANEMGRGQSEGPPELLRRLSEIDLVLDMEASS